MKSAYISFMVFLSGFILFVSISVVFQYTTTYKNLSFELRNALMSAGEEAMIPEEVCEMVACSESEREAPSFGCSEEGYIEECVDVYMEEDEFFGILLGHLKRLKRTSERVSVRLKAFHNPPFMAKAEVSVNLNSGFLRVPIVIEEVCLEN